MEQGEHADKGQASQVDDQQAASHHEPIRRCCSECQQNLTGSSFSAHQWKLNDSRRRCKTCLRDDMEQGELAGQGQASQQGGEVGHQQVDDQQQQHEPIRRKSCSECQQNLPGSSFSTHQWKLSDSRRRCKTCLREDMEQGEHGGQAQASQQGGEGQQQAQNSQQGDDQRGHQHEPIRRCCSECQQNLTGSSFSAHQWGLNDSRRRCKTCLREDMEQGGQQGGESGRLQRQQADSDAVSAKVLIVESEVVLVVDPDVMIIESTVMHMTD